MALLGQVILATSSTEAYLQNKKLLTRVTGVGLQNEAL